MLVSTYIYLFSTDFFWRELYIVIDFDVFSTFLDLNL